MRFKELIRKHILPNELLEFLSNRKIRAINKAHQSGDLVFDVDNQFILKISLNEERLQKEKEANDILIHHIPVSKTVMYLKDDKYTYYLKTKIIGTPLVNKVNNPKLLIKLIKEAISIFHGVDITGLNLERMESGQTLVHGDFCLPNILVYKNKISGFIDLEGVCIGDPWVDYSWCIWSFEYNLKTKKYNEDLFKELNIIFDQNKFDKYVN